MWRAILSWSRIWASITPGKCADILLIDDIQKVEPSTVITDGQVIFDKEAYGGFPVFILPGAYSQFDECEAGANSGGLQA